LTRRVILTLLFCLSSTVAFAASPIVGNITPSGGSCINNQTVTFTTTYTDLDGWSNIQYVHLLIDKAINGTNCFYGYYNQNSHRLYLRDNGSTAWLGGSAPGSANIIENSYVKLNCNQTTVSGNNATLTAKWSITFKPTFVGTKNTYLFVKDDANFTSNWVQKGTWTIIDNIPPTGSISINSGANYTKSIAVTLSLSAQDTGSGMGSGAQMRFSNNNLNWTTPEAYLTLKSWNLTSGDTAKTVYVKFKDAAGNWCNAYSDTIKLDTVKPTITITTPQNGTVFTGP
jgi:hypothetical protein